MRQHSNLSPYWQCALGVFALLLVQRISDAGIEARSSETMALGVELQLEEIIRSPEILTEAALQHIDKVSAFYIARNYRPAWHNQQQLLPQADNFLQYANQAHQQGLAINDLNLDVIAALRDNLSAFDKARLDILLTDAFVTLSLRAAQGRLDPMTIDKEWHYQRPEVDVVSFLSDALQSDDIAGKLDSLLPKNSSYKRLVSALAFYRNLARQGDWPRLSPDSPLLRYGMRSDEIVLLRERLRLTGDLTATVSDPAYFDRQLEHAVRHFQQRHGLADDGVVGANTRRALNTPLEQRIQQIMLNLERWCWMPRELGERHIRIDLAGFRLSVHEKDSVPLSMRVIVGRQSRMTPSFSSNLHHLVFNPYWNVPEIIAIKDIIPRAIRDPDYLSRNRIRVLQGYGQNENELDPSIIDWSSYRRAMDLPFRFRQDPGVKNSLGQIKFMLPNRFAILLHDTPSKHLFSKSVRAYSSGCVRVEDPLALADYVMGDQWQQADIQKIMAKKQNKALALPSPIPVHMVYQTAWVEHDGTVQFRNDIYDRDRQMLAAMRQFDIPLVTDLTQAADNYEVLLGHQ